MSRLSTSFTIDRGRLSLRDALAVAATLACKPCCREAGGGSGGGSLGSGSHSIECCPGILLPDTLHITISGTIALNGTYALHWTEAFHPYIGASHIWVSDAIFQFICDFGFGNIVTYRSYLAFHPVCFVTWAQTEDNGSGELATRGQNGGLPGVDLQCDPFYYSLILAPIPAGSPRADCPGTPDNVAHAEVTL